MPSISLFVFFCGAGPREYFLLIYLFIERLRVRWYSWVKVQEWTGARKVAMHAAQNAALPPPSAGLTLPLVDESAPISLIHRVLHCLFNNRVIYLSTKYPSSFVHPSPDYIID